MNETESLINSLRNQKKQLLDNALDGVTLSEDDIRYLTYLLAQSDLHELQHFCNLLIKVRVQCMKA